MGRRVGNVVLERILSSTLHTCLVYFNYFESILKICYHCAH